MEGGARSIAVVGAGAWGTALAVHLARHGRPVRLWCREPHVVAELREQRRNTTFLPGVELPRSVEPVGALAEAVAGSALVVSVVPSRFARATYRAMAPDLAGDVPFVVATKGIEEESLGLPLEVAAAELGRPERMAVLSGPSFAAEVARGRPTAVVVAATVGDLADAVQRVFASPELRTYTSRDVLGVELAGALKNVIAIAAGVADSLGMGANAQAALITRGLAEIARLGRALGGQPATFAGLAGLGDLVLTCTGGLSRNRQLGQRLGRGERLGDILTAVPHEVEGVHTTRAAREMARRAGVGMPIVEELYGVLFDDLRPAAALERLMLRPLAAEHPDGNG